MEEMQKNSGDTFAAEFEEFEKSLITLNTRDIVKGTVISVSDAGVSVNLGYKSDGFVPASEVTDDPSADIKSLVKPGDEIEAFVVRVNDVEGEVTLSMRKLIAMKGIQEIKGSSRRQGYTGCKRRRNHYVQRRESVRSGISGKRQILS